MGCWRAQPPVVRGSATPVLHAPRERHERFQVTPVASPRVWAPTKPRGESSGNRRVVGSHSRRWLVLAASPEPHLGRPCRQWHGTNNSRGPNRRPVSSGDHPPGGGHAGRRRQWDGPNRPAAQIGFKFRASPRHSRPPVGRPWPLLLQMDHVALGDTLQRPATWVGTDKTLQSPKLLFNAYAQPRGLLIEKAAGPPPHSSCSWLTSASGRRSAGSAGSRISLLSSPPSR